MLDTILKVYHAFSGIELYKIAEKTLIDLEEKWEHLAVKPELILITQLERDYIQNKVKEMKFSKEINPSIIISSIIRAALDCRAYGLIKKDLIDKVLTEIKAKEESCKCVGFYCVAKYAVMAATKEFIAQGICKNKTATVEYVQ